MNNPERTKEELIKLAISFEDDACERENINPGRAASFYAKAAEYYEQAGMAEDAQRCLRKSNGAIALRNQIDMFGPSFSSMD